MAHPESIKIWLTSVNLSIPKCCPNVTTPCSFKRRRHSMAQIAAEWLEIAQWSQWRPYRKPPSLFRMVHHWPLRSATSPFPQMGVPNVPARPISRRLLPPLESSFRKPFSTENLQIWHHICLKSGRHVEFSTIPQSTGHISVFLSRHFGGDSHKRSVALENSSWLNKYNMFLWFRYVLIILYWETNHSQLYKPHLAEVDNNFAMPALKFTDTLIIVSSSCVHSMHYLLNSLTEAY